MKYTLKVSDRARVMRLAVYPDGAVVVTAPRFFAVDAIESFVTKHSEWVRDKVERTESRNVVRIARKDIPALKERAHALANERCEHFARAYGLSYNKISIRAQKTRWGSCTKTGNLSFNYKVAILPARLADYIFVHEICHLGVFNHSGQFWELVAREIPDHKTIRKEVRTIVTVFEK